MPVHTRATPPQDTVIFETIHGSRAYGLATDSSDTDLRGVFVPSPIAFTGFVDQPDQLEPGRERVLYEIRKFFRLAAECTEGRHRVLSLAAPAGRGRLEPLVLRPRGRGASEDHVTLDLSKGRRFLATQGAPSGLVVGVTGAHYYGFPSPDSDLDLKGIHVAPTHEVVALHPPPDSVDFLGIFEGGRDRLHEP